MIAGALSIREVKTNMAMLIEKVSARRPDLMSTELNRRNAETGIGQARADYLPSLNLMGQIDWNSTNVAEANAKSWAVMAVLLGHVVHPGWYYFTGFVGVMLMIFALTGFCPMSIILHNKAYKAGARKRCNC